MDWREIRQELAIAIGHAEEATEAAKKMLEKVDYKAQEIRAVALTNGDIETLYDALSVILSVKTSSYLAPIAETRERLPFLKEHFGRILKDT